MTVDVPGGFARATSLIRDIVDYPRQGIVFKDITPLLQDSAAFAVVVNTLAEQFTEVDLVVGIEARGFILGAPVAVALGAGFVPVRKKGKLPHHTVGTSYALEYGTAEIEMHVDGIIAGQRVAVIDDVLATGGTAAATCALVEQVGGVVQGLGVLLELGFLGGRSKLGDRQVRSLLTV
jgi:adenine phosphoribosyltransferase